jgi:tRNA pseudouridine38-40 synthase
MGTAYAGFQRQPNRVTVQGTIEQALKAVTGEDISLVAAGRTDGGAHACAQVIAFSTDTVIGSERLRMALNAHLPRDIAVTSAADVQPHFHPRFDALRRTYRYLIWNRRTRSPYWEGRAAFVPSLLDVDAMDAAGRLLTGRHDFSAFVAAAATGNRTRIMHRVSCRRDDDLVTVEMEANGFMQQMARSIAGTLIDVGRGSLNGQDVFRMLESEDRSRGGPTAPAHGLYLTAVTYTLAESETDHDRHHHRVATNEEQE